MKQCRSFTLEIRCLCNNKTNQWRYNRSYFNNKIKLICLTDFHLRQYMLVKTISCLFLRMAYTLRFTWNNHTWKNMYLESTCRLEINMEYTCTDAYVLAFSEIRKMQCVEIYTLFCNEELTIFVTYIHQNILNYMQIMQ